MIIGILNTDFELVSVAERNVHNAQFTNPVRTKEILRIAKISLQNQQAAN